MSVGRKGGKLFPIVGRDQQLHAYKEAVKAALAEQSPVLLEGKIVLYIWFWRNQATYETHQAKTHRKHEADCTNMFKATEDACQGILFKNDKDNIQTHGYIVEQGPDVTPMVVIYLHQPSRLITSEDEMLSLMEGDVQEMFLGMRMLAATEGLLGANTALTEDEDPDWEGGEF